MGNEYTMPFETYLKLESTVQTMQDQIKWLEVIARDETEAMTEDSALEGITYGAEYVARIQLVQYVLHEVKKCLDEVQGTMDKQDHLQKYHK